MSRPLSKGRHDPYTFLIISRSILFIIRNVSDTYCRENQNTHFVFSNLKKNCAVYEIMWKNIAERGRPQMTIWRMRIACWVTEATKMTVRRFHTACWLTNATKTYSKYVTLSAFSTARMVTRTRLNVTLYVHCFARCTGLISQPRCVLITFIVTCHDGIMTNKQTKADSTR